MTCIFMDDVASYTIHCRSSQQALFQVCCARKPPELHWGLARLCIARVCNACPQSDLQHIVHPHLYLLWMQWRQRRSASAESGMWHRLRVCPSRRGRSLQLLLQLPRPFRLPCLYLNRSQVSLWVLTLSRGPSRTLQRSCRR